MEQRITRHIGTVQGLGSRAIVVFREIPDDSDHCLVLMADSLPEVYRDAVSNVVSGVRGQSTADLYEVLHAETMPTGEPMLMALHNGKFLQRYPTSKVTMHPTRTDTIRLDELNEHLRTVKAEAAGEQTGDIQKKFNPYQDKAEELDVADAQNIAQRLITEAEDLRTEAKRKEERALKLRPELAETVVSQDVDFLVEQPTVAVDGTADPFALMEAVANLSELDSLTVLDGLLQRHPMTAPVPTDVSDEDGKFSIDLRECSQRNALDQIKKAWREANPSKTKN